MFAFDVELEGAIFGFDKAAAFRCVDAAGIVISITMDPAKHITIDEPLTAEADQMISSEKESDKGGNDIDHGHQM